MYNADENNTGDLLNGVLNDVAHGKSFFHTHNLVFFHRTYRGAPIGEAYLRQIVGRITRRCSHRLHYTPGRGMPRIRIYDLVSTPAFSSRGEALSVAAASASAEGGAYGMEWLRSGLGISETPGLNALLRTYPLGSISSGVAYRCCGRRSCRTRTRPARRAG